MTLSWLVCVTMDAESELGEGELVEHGIVEDDFEYRLLILKFGRSLGDALHTAHS